MELSKLSMLQPSIACNLAPQLIKIGSSTKTTFQQIYERGLHDNIDFIPTSSRIMIHACIGEWLCRIQHILMGYGLQSRIIHTRRMASSSGVQSKILLQNMLTISIQRLVLSKEIQSYKLDTEKLSKPAM